MWVMETRNQATTSSAIAPFGGFCNIIPLFWLFADMHSPYGIVPIVMGRIRISGIIEYRRYIGKSLSSKR